MESMPFDYRKYLAELKLKYDVELDETSATILFVLEKQIEKKFHEQITLIINATEKINDSQRTLEVSRSDPKKQAFWFGMGRSGLAIAMAIFFIGVFLVYYQYKENQQEKLPDLTLWYKNYYERTQNMSKKSVIEYLEKNPMP